MYPLVATKDPCAVEREVQSAYRAMFPGGNPSFISDAFTWAIDCFTGKYPGYQAIDAKYHDFEHTLQGTLCLVRLLRGRHEAAVQPELTQKLFELGVLAILFHDAGYLKRSGDVEGTGAKYTQVHVMRSAEFAGQLLKEREFSAGDINAVLNMIYCSEVDVSLERIPFQSDLEKTVGMALGTADLLGQMAAEDYVDKLPALYLEFAEAAQRQREKTDIAGRFSSADELMRKTPAFWAEYVRCKLDREFGGVYRFLNQPYPAGPNYYLQQIEANLARLRR
jgi:hypothetical protein